jgi:hypothetical protein
MPWDVRVQLLPNCGVLETWSSPLSRCQIDSPAGWCRMA